MELKLLSIQFKIRKISWITQVGPVLSHESEESVTERCNLRERQRRDEAKVKSERFEA